MIASANLKEASRSLLSAKQRTVLALIGIVIGIGSVIAMVSVGRIVQNEALRQFKEMGTDILSIEKEFAQPRQGGGAAKPQPGLSLADIRAIPSACNTITVVAPMLRGSGEVSISGRRLERAGVMGVTEAFLAVNRLSMAEGRFLSDLDEQSRYCVIGSRVAEELKKAGVTQLTGSRIKVGENLLTIVGITAPVPEGGMRRFEPNEMVYVHITTGLRIFANSEISSITAREIGRASFRERV
mgnify:FL=1